MVRDFDLIRKVMLEVQGLPADSLPVTIHFDGKYDQRTVDEHLAMLIDVGLLSGNVSRYADGKLAVTICRLTWAGHDFLNSITDESVWMRAKATVLKPTIAFTFDLLKEWLKYEAKTRLKML